MCSGDDMNRLERNCFATFDTLPDRVLKAAESGTHRVFFHDARRARRRWRHPRNFDEKLRPMRNSARPSIYRGLQYTYIHKQLHSHIASAGRIRRRPSCLSDAVLASPFLRSAVCADLLFVVAPSVVAPYPSQEITSSPTMGYLAANLDSQLMGETYMRERERERERLRTGFFWIVRGERGRRQEAG